MDEVEKRVMTVVKTIKPQNGINIGIICVGGITKLYINGDPIWRIVNLSFADDLVLGPILKYEVIEDERCSDHRTK